MPGFRYDLLSSLAFIAASIYVIAESAGMPPPDSGKIGPGFWPSILGWLLLSFSLGILGKAIFRKIAALRRTGSLSSAPPGLFGLNAPGMRHVYLLCALFAVFSLLLHGFGFIVASLFILPSCMRLLGEKRLRVLGMATAAVTAAIYVIFEMTLRIPLPTGEWL